MLLLLARVLAGVGFAALLLYFLVALPHQQALEKAKASKDQIITVQKSLDNGADQIRGLPQPSSITPQVFGAAKDYVGQIDALLPTVNPGHVDQPKQISSNLFDKYIQDYNQVIAKKGYVDSLGQGLTALGDDLDFLNHYRASMYAAANLLEYNPELESKDKQPGDIPPLLQAAAVGLDKTIARLNDAPKFKDDTLTALIDEVKKVDAARKTYEDALSANPPALSQRSAYIAAVAAAQKAIIANRQKFWEENYNNYADKTAQAAEALRPFSTDIQNL